MHTKNIKNNRIKNTIKAFAAAGLVSLAVGGEAQAKGGCNASHTGGGYGALGDGVFPTSCWRPYAEESPFNDRLSRTPQVEEWLDRHH